MSAIFKTLKPSDVNVTEFRSYKSWDITNDDSGSGVLVMRAEYTSSKLPIGTPDADSAPLNPDGSYQYIIWESIEHLYYTQQPDRFKQLYEVASVLSVPQLKLGEGIKSETVWIDDNSYDPALITLRADEDGIIRDTSLVTASYIDDTNCVAYYGFNEKFREKNSEGIIRDFSKNQNHAKFVNLTFTGGLQLQDSASVTTGTQANFFGDGYVKIEDYAFINFHVDDDFAISLAFQTPTPGATQEFLISKEGEEPELKYDPQSKLTNWHNTPYLKVVYPYRIYLFSGAVYAESFDGKTLVQLSTLVQNAVSDHQYVTFSKSGSLYELYVDGSLVDSVTATLDLKTQSKSNIYIGSKDQSSGFYSGSIDEVRFWNKGLSAAEAVSLATNTYASPAAYNTNIVGNVMAAHGIVVLSSPSTKYRNLILGDGDWDYTGFPFNATWKSTQTIYEYESICSVNMGEYNSTLNPSAIKDGDSYLYKDFVTGSEFTPYITTIGLYDDFGQLLAVGKLTRPIQKRNDININYVVRFDI